jgi:hypothetical protein
VKQLRDALYKLRLQCEFTNRRIEAFQRSHGVPNSTDLSYLDRLGYLGSRPDVPQQPPATSAVLMPQFARSTPGVNSFIEVYINPERYEIDKYDRAERRQSSERETSIGKHSLLLSS